MWRASVPWHAVCSSPGYTRPAAPTGERDPALGWRGLARSSVPGVLITLAGALGGWDMCQDQGWHHNVRRARYDHVLAFVSPVYGPC